MLKARLLKIFYFLQKVDLYYTYIQLSKDIFIFKSSNTIYQYLFLDPLEVTEYKFNKHKSTMIAIVNNNIHG